MNKLQGSRTCFYSLEDDPLFYDPTNRAESVLRPTRKIHKKKKKNNGMIK